MWARPNLIVGSPLLPSAMLRDADGHLPSGVEPNWTAFGDDAILYRMRHIRAIAGAQTVTSLNTGLRADEHRDDHGWTTPRLLHALEAQGPDDSMLPCATLTLSPHRIRACAVVVFGGQDFDKD